MGIEQIKAGHNTPDDINVIIEIAAKSSPVKYEMDKESGVLQVDRFIGTHMHYPCDYGFIPQTLSEDGDPVDVLVVAPFPLLPGSLIRCRPIGVLRMTDESGKDAKILAVPIDKLCASTRHLHAPNDLGEHWLSATSHFFQHYKDLEPGKWVKIDGWENSDAAKTEIENSIRRYQETHSSIQN